jgi:phosphoribosylanthranilate isomerase
VAQVWTKICGITRAEDAEAAANAGADAIGLNFCATSPRRCEPAAAAAIVRAVGGTIAAYGVFAGMTPEEVAGVAERVRLAGVQLHGGEDVAYAERLRALLPRSTAIVRVIAVESRAAVEQALDAAAGDRRLRGAGAHRVLLDSPRGGGSGTHFDGAVVEGLDLSAAIVAGGLGPANVAGVVARLCPYGVDVASGVERAPGIKDEAKIREFIENAKRSAA